MKAGDLIKVPKCVGPGGGFILCECFFCSNNSNRLGIVVEVAIAAPSQWHVQFDHGRWWLYNDEVEVISAANR